VIFYFDLKSLFGSLILTLIWNHFCLWSFPTLRAFFSRNTSILVKAYITYVRPLLEHNTVIWSPYKVSDISSIEKVQRRFTKRLPGLKNLTYKQRLVATNLDTLELRRLCTDLVVCYKIVFGLIKVDVNKFFSFAPVINTHGHRYKLSVEQSTHNVRHYFFCRRVVKFNI